MSGFVIDGVGVEVQEKRPYLFRPGPHGGRAPAGEPLNAIRRAAEQPAARSGAGQKRRNAGRALRPRAVHYHSYTNQQLPTKLYS